MNINDLIRAVNPEIITSGLALNKPLRPTISPLCDEDDLLFVYRRVGGEYSAMPEQIERRPYALVCDSEYARSINDIPLIIVKDTRAAYAHACYLYNEIDAEKMKLIAVTGTNGKTTTATLINAILNHAGMKCGQIGTGTILSGDRNLADSDYSMTTPDPEQLYKALRQMQNDGCSAVVIEATSHALSLGKLAPLEFDIGIFTNLSHEHLDFHEDIESYYQAKLSLFKQAKQAIINIDDEFGERAYNECVLPKTSVGIVGRADAFVTDIERSGEMGTRFYYRESNLITRVEIQLPGAFNIYNAALAMKCAIELGITPKLAKEAIGSLKCVAGRMEIVHAGPLVIIDYAHTPVAMENAIKSLNKRKKPGQKLTVVFGCGGERDKDKRPIMARISEKYATNTIITSDNSRGEDPKKIEEDICRGFLSRHSYTLISDRKEAIEYALSKAEPCDIVAILGKGHERYIIDAEGKHMFDEKEIVDSFFKKQGGAKNENNT